MILIAGPCVVENRNCLQQTVEMLLYSIQEKNIDFYFKSSFLKDNRTKTQNFKTIGIEKAIYLLKEIKKEFNVKICTDFHNEKQIVEYGNGFDIIQIPAFLAQQQSILKAASISSQLYGSKVFVKKPQNLSPMNVENIVEILIDYGMSIESIIIGDRGTSFGYDSLIMDPRHLPIIKETGVKTIVDITHPQKGFSSKIDNRKLSETLALSYIAAGADGIFLETHPEVENALCDSTTMNCFSSTEKIIQASYRLFNIREDYLPHVGDK